MDYCSIPSGVEAIFLFASDTSNVTPLILKDKNDLTSRWLKCLCSLLKSSIKLMWLASLDNLAAIILYLNMICSKASVRVPKPIKFTLLQ